MRRLMTAAFLLILMPSSASACFEDHKAEWIAEKPSGSRGFAGTSAEGSRWEQMLGTWIIAGGSASLALGAVSIRAISRTTGRGRQDPLEPTNPLPSESVSEQPGCPVGKGVTRLGPRLSRRTL